MRPEGWEALLHDHLRTAPAFAWGETDCALWCADWVRKLTGIDFGAGWRGRYSTESGLRGLMAGRGIKTPAEIADETGFPVIHLAFAQRGDVVQHPTGPLGICDGVFSHFLMTDGVTRFPTAACVKAWAVR